jgi:hypothetical protein
LVPVVPVMPDLVSPYSPPSRDSVATGQEAANLDAATFILPVRAGVFRLWAYRQKRLVYGEALSHSTASAAVRAIVQCCTTVEYYAQLSTPHS